MTRRASQLLKWGIVPAFAALVGYVWIGPHYAGDPRLKGLVQKGKEVVEAHRLKSTPAPAETPAVAEPTPEIKPDTSQAPAPRVSLGVKPVAVDAPSEPTSRRRRRRRHRTTAAPSDEATPEPAATPERTGPDPASTP